EPPPQLGSALCLAAASADFRSSASARNVPRQPRIRGVGPQRRGCRKLGVSAMDPKRAALPFSRVTVFNSSEVQTHIIMDRHSRQHVLRPGDRKRDVELLIGVVAVFVVAAVFLTDKNAAASWCLFRGPLIAVTEVQVSPAFETVIVGHTPPDVEIF